MADTELSNDGLPGIDAAPPPSCSAARLLRKAGVRAVAPPPLQHPRRHRRGRHRGPGAVTETRQAMSDVAVSAKQGAEAARR